MSFTSVSFSISSLCNSWVSPVLSAPRGSNLHRCSWEVHGHSFYSSVQGLKKAGQGWVCRVQVTSWINRGLRFNTKWGCLCSLELFWVNFLSCFTMFSVEVDIANRACSGYQDQHPHTILYNILSWRDSDHLDHEANSYLTSHTCHCKQRKVRLKDPTATCQVASSVLIKTVCFVRSLPSFSQLPLGDQSSLLTHCWVPLFVLGLAQERIMFEVTDVPNPSILRQILLRPGLSEKEADQPTLAGVHRLRACLYQLWDLDLSPKEYAYLRGATLFNPGTNSLSIVCFTVKVFFKECLLIWVWLSYYFRVNRLEIINYSKKTVKSSKINKSAYVSINVLHII